MSALQEHLADIARSCEYHDGAGFPDDHDADDDCSVDALIAYKDALEDEVGRLFKAAEAASDVAQCLPLKDDWKSAADLIEGIAGILDRHDVSRPDRYPDDWK